MNIPVPDRFYEHLVAGCPDAVIFADTAGIVRYWNEAATRIFGFSTAEAVGKRLNLIIPQRLQDRHWKGYDKVVNGAQSHYGQGAVLAVPAVRKDGREISIEFTILPLHDATGALLGIAAFLRDVTTRFEETRALRRELTALKQSAGSGKSPAD